MIERKNESGVLNYISWRLYVATFVTGLCGHTVIIFISAYVYYTTETPVLAAAILAGSFAPQAFATRILGLAVDKYGSVSMFMLITVINWCVGVGALELVAGGSSVYVIMPLILVRALCAATERANTVKLLRYALSVMAIRTGLSIMNFGYFAATAVAGLGLIFISLDAVGLLIGVVTALYATAIAVVLPIATLRGRLSYEAEIVEAQTTLLVPVESERGTAKDVRSLRFYIWLVRVSEAFYQGAYNALVTYIPLHIFATDHVPVGAYQVAASLGIIVGFVFAQLVLRKARDEKQILVIVGVCGVFASLGWVMSVNETFTVWGSLMAFCILCIGYESVWLVGTVQIDANAPFDRVAEISFRTGAWAALWMAVFTVGYGYIISTDIPVQISAAALAGAGLLTLVSGAALTHRQIEEGA